MMISVEQIVSKAQVLDTVQLQELTDFMDFLLHKYPTKTQQEPVFPVTQLESLDTPSLYQGKALSLEDMQKAIEWEAGQSS